MRSDENLLVLLAVISIGIDDLLTGRTIVPCGI